MSAEKARISQEYADDDKASFLLSLRCQDSLTHQTQPAAAQSAEVE